VWCRVVLCRVVSCWVVSCRVVSCRVVLSRVVSCCVVLCCYFVHACHLQCELYGLFISSFLILSRFTVWIICIITRSIFWIWMSPANTFSCSVPEFMGYDRYYSSAIRSLHSVSTEGRNKGMGRGRCSCPRRNSVYLLIINIKRSKSNSHYTGRTKNARRNPQNVVFKLKSAVCLIVLRTQRGWNPLKLLLKLVANLAFHLPLSSTGKLFFWPVEYVLIILKNIRKMF
jgi:hypothetical protein